MPTLTRRFTLSLGLSMAAGRALAQPRPIESRVVIATFGGLLGKLVRANVELFTKPAGIDAVFVEGGSADILAKLRAQKNAPQFDLALLNDQTFVVADALGLIAPLDRTEVPNAASLRPGCVTAKGFGAAYEINPIGYMYRRDRLAAAGVPPPGTWRAVLDPRLAGRVITYSFSAFYTPLQMAGLELSRGRPISEDGEIWLFMRAMKDNRTIVVANPGQVEDLMKAGEAWVAPATANRTLLLQQQGADVGFSPCTDALMSLTNYMAPVKGCQHPVAAQRVLNWILSPEVQERAARDAAVVPVNGTVALSPALKQRMGFPPDQPVPSFKELDVATLNDEFGAWSEQFDKIMAF